MKLHILRCLVDVEDLVLFKKMAPCSLPVFITHAGRRHDNDAATTVHPGGDGPCVDGEESVQREADGAAGGRPVDRNDQVDERKSLLLK